MKSLTLTRGVALLGALTLLPAANAVAAASTPSGENTPLNLGGGTAATHASASGGASIVRTIVGLFVVIAVIYGIAWILKQAKKGKTRATGNGLSQVASLPLGSGRSVTVVRAGREVIVVGVAENGVTPLRTYSEAEAIALGIDVPTQDHSAPDPAEKPMDRVLDVLRRITVRS
jgi:flagellar protein FliO/FliZ